jgi:hypothetical protein
VVLGAPLLARVHLVVALGAARAGQVRTREVVAAPAFGRRQVGNLRQNVGKEMIPNDLDKEASGTNANFLKNSPKKAFSTRNTAKLCKNWIIILIKKKRYFFNFSPKSSKNC